MTIKSSIACFLLTLLAILLLTAFAPLEKTLGANARIVYLHGAWVWAALATILVAAVAGLVGLLARLQVVQRWSRALGRAGLLMWVAFLPMSLVVMQVNWNGLFLDEPRFRVPFNFAIIGLLLQVGLSFFPNLAWTALANLVYGAALLVGVQSMQNVLHPVSPVFTSGSTPIKFFFGTLLVLMLVLSWQIARFFYQLDAHKAKMSVLVKL